MKALVLTDMMTFDFTEYPEPKVNSDEVRIRIKACGICGSDIHGIDGTSGRRIPPIIMGHEASGVVESVGVSVKKMKAGDRVTFDSTIYCGECDYCRKGLTNLCSNRKVIGVSCNDYHRNGAMAELITVPEYIVYKIPDAVSYEHAAMVEPLSVAVHAVMQVKPDIMDTAVVIGCGIIGQLIIQCLRVVGCYRIIAVDVDDDKLKTAGNLGATSLINSHSENVQELVEKLTLKEGADIGFEAVGITDTVNFGISLIKKGGSFCLVGNISKNIGFPLQNVVTREIQVFSSCASNGEYDTALKLLESGSIDLSPLISATSPLCKGGEWFTRLYNHEKGLMKVLLTP
jgi:L-iditol 2-dehydrogenase